MFSSVIQHKIHDFSILFSLYEPKAYTPKSLLISAAAVNVTPAFPMMSAALFHGSHYERSHTHLRWNSRFETAENFSPVTERIVGTLAGAYRIGLVTGGAGCGSTARRPSGRSGFRARPERPHGGSAFRSAGRRRVFRKRPGKRQAPHVSNGSKHAALADLGNARAA